MTQPPNFELPNQSQASKPGRRSFYLQVLLPLILGLFVLAAVILLLWQSGVASASAWADASMVFLFIPWLCVGILPAAALGALWFGLFKLTAWLPAPLRKLNGYIEQGGRYLRQGTDVVVKPMFVVKGAWAVVVAFFNGLASLLDLYDGESDE